MSFQQEPTNRLRQVLTSVSDRLWHDAVHDAARIAISRALGLPSVYANLTSEYEERSAGHAFIFDALQSSEWNRLHPERNGGDRAFWRGRTISDMAGAEAEREIIGWSADEHGRAQCGFGYSNQRPDGSARMRRFARQLVKRHRTTILRFADQLIAADELGELLAR